MVIWIPINIKMSIPCTIVEILLENFMKTQPLLFQLFCKKKQINKWKVPKYIFLVRGNEPNRILLAFEKKEQKRRVIQSVLGKVFIIFNIYTHSFISNGQA